MYSIIEQAGVQFKVTPGEKIDVPLIDAEAGTDLTIDKVLLTADGEKVTIGMPTIAGATVTARVLSHGQDKKVLVIKKKKRKDYKRKNGHRQQFTKIEIISINA
ncbi:MAG: 50S ribosomal protein L21 [Chitinispirillia bacterium]|nr:50S ribosomal protein L21 [Chitinispirillia bacterium]MCL2242056.1 50S ribosomal protein L21 [Chitinispirillia bacterium]